MRRTSRWSKIGLAVLAVGSVLAMAGLLYASSGGETGSLEYHGGHPVPTTLSHEKIMDLVWRTLNFAALVAILVKFLAKPIAHALGGRRQAIKGTFEDLDARKSEAEQMYREHEGRLARLDEEVKQIIAAAVAQGELEKQRLIEEANRAAESIKRQAEMAVQHELAEAKRRLREEIAEQSAAMAEEIIKQNLKPTDQDRLIESYLEKVGGQS